MSISDATCPLTGEPILEGLSPRGRPEEQIYLTEGHVGQHTRVWGRETYTCIPLSQLAAVTYDYQARWSWLVGAGAAMLVALALAFASKRAGGTRTGELLSR